MLNFIRPGVFAGLLAGVVWALLIVLFVSPLILEAEKYEGGETGVTTHSHDSAAGERHGHGGHSHDHGEGSVALNRTIGTFLGTAGLGVAYGIIALLLFVSLWKELGPENKSVGILEGVKFGLGAFLAIHVVPSIGLPPPPPGVSGAEGDLGARQIWWMTAVGLTFVGLVLFRWLSTRFTQLRNMDPIAAKGMSALVATVVIAIPFLIGVPEHAVETSVPTELQSRFMWVTLIVNGVFWVVLGSALSFFSMQNLSVKRV